MIFCVYLRKIPFAIKKNNVMQSFSTSYAIVVQKGPIYELIKRKYNDSITDIRTNEYFLTLKKANNRAKTLLPKLPFTAEENVIVVHEPTDSLAFITIDGDIIKKEIISSKGAKKLYTVLANAISFYKGKNITFIFPCFIRENSKLFQKNFIKCLLF